MKLSDQIKKIAEKIKKANETKESFKILYNTAIKFYSSKLIGGEIKVKLIRKKLKKTTQGYIDLIDTIDSIKNQKSITIYVTDAHIKLSLAIIAHEMTHAKQIYKKELQLSDNKEYIIWKNKLYMEVEDYENAGFNEWKKAPWEIEANKNKDILSEQFIKSNEFKELKSINKILEMIVENI